jgi:hypothetical protein
MRLRFLAWFGFSLATLSLPATAAAYSVYLHDRLPDALYGLPMTADAAALPDDAGLAAFRRRFWERASKAEDGGVRLRFLQRYPTAESFDAGAFKEFFGMSATNPALGFDPYAAVAASAEQRDGYGPIGPGAPRPLLAWVRTGSDYPDLDRRNRGRWHYVSGRIERAPDGERVPSDPVILNMGQVEPLSGQAHAHYGLNRRPKSTEPDVLKTRPADFAVPIGFPEAPVLTFAPERAQSYADLAVIARAEGQPALAALFAGNAFHYLADVGNQIHTIQVGIYDFFVDATLQAWKMKVLTLGGLLGTPPTRNQIGIDIIGNHHTWSEELFRIAVARAYAGKPLSPALASPGALWRPAPALAAQWQDAFEKPDMLRELADRIILAGNVEGPEIYQLTRTLTTGDLRKAGVKYDFDLESDATVLAKLAAGHDADLAQFLTLQSRGTVRAGTAMALWWGKVFAAPPDADAALARLLRRNLDEMTSADARRTIFVRKHAK